jgi:curli production assembly/transport component CsgF
MKLVTRAAVIALSVPMLCSSAWAGTLVYTPINPSFGGDPLNSSHLLGLASAQRTATASDAKSGSGGDGDGGTGSTPGSSDADLFVRQLQGRLLSALASQVTEAIFGQDPQNYGEVQFGDTTVIFERDTLNGYITLTIADLTGTTVIKVPMLITN